MNNFPFPSRWPTRITFGVGLAFVAIFSLVPAIAIIGVSLTDLRGLPGLPVHWVGFDNYISFFSPAKRGDSFNALKNTIVFATISTVVQISLALVVAVVLNGRLKGRNFLRAVVFMPTILGVTVTGLVWSLFFNVNAGPAATVLSWFGGDSAFFGDPNIALALVIFVQIWMIMGISVVIFLAGLQSIPEELYEAANVDGATARQKFRFVTIPMLYPSITTNVLLGIVNALQSYQLTYVLAGPSNRSTQVLSLLLYVEAFGAKSGTTLSQSQGYAAAISMIQFALVGVVSLGALWYLRRKEPLQ